MELLNKLTIKNLALNKKRTIVTIIGIILATALIVGTTTLVASFKKSIVEYEKETSGNFHYEFCDVPSKDIKYIENNRNIESLFFTQSIGYSKLEGSKNKNKPYLYLIGFTKDAMNNTGLSLLEGRFPDNDSEIIISKHIQTNGGVDLKVGQEITLSIGKRVSNGIELNQNTPYVYLYNDLGEVVEAPNEEILEEFTKTYKIVGIIERPNSYSIENYTAPGYTIITYLEKYTDNSKLNIFVRYKNLKLQDETTSQIVGVKEEVLDFVISNRKYTQDDLPQEKWEEYQKKKYDVDANYSLIRIENMQFNDGTIIMIMNVAIVVIAIIIVSSVFCIRNSFAISITEKTKQYGMLASIGATSKQIKKNVLYEALILAVIGIPLGIISGTGAIYVLLKVINKILPIDFFGMQFRFSTNWIAILIAIVLSSITIYLSARKSAKKASKISPIDAIRSNQDIKIKSKKIKSPKIIKKIFGIGGDIAYKNLKRNNKKYRTTVISIVVSISIFIAMSYFITSALGITELYITDYNYDILLRGNDYENLKEISKDSQLKDYELTRIATVYCEDAKNHQTEEQKDEKEYYVYRNGGYIMHMNNKNSATTIYMISLGETEYANFIKKLRLDYEDVKDKAILMDYNIKVNVLSDSKEKQSFKKFRIYDYKEGDILKGDIGIDEKHTIDIEIAKITDEEPMELPNEYPFCFLIVSDEYMDKIEYEDNIAMYIKTKEDVKLTEYIKKNYSDKYEDISNINENTRAEKAMWITVSIFLYGFITVISLIGVTNIFNTITTNMELRQKEFANLKSIGMTKKEFNRMIRLESLFYGLKSLIIGITIGIILSYIIYKAAVSSADLGFKLPFTGIVISIIAVSLLIGAIMKYSLNKINKQNIIETIRKDNI